MNVQFDIENDGEEFLEKLSKEDFKRFNGEQTNTKTKGDPILLERLDAATLASISKMP